VDVRNCAGQQRASKPAEQVPMRVAKSILRAAQAQGYGVEDILASLDVSCNPMACEDSANLDADTYNRIYRRIMDLLQDECFGLNLNTKIPAGTLRMTCLCIIHCTSLRHAIERAGEFNQFCRALLGMQRSQRVPLLEADGIATMVFEHNPWLFGHAGEENVQALAYAISSWRRLCSWLIGRNIEPIEVLLNIEEPPRALNLAEIFTCPVRYEQSVSGFRFAAFHLDSPIIQTEDSLREFLRSAPFQLIAKAGDDDDDNVIGQMRRLVGNDFSRDFPPVTAMADTLGMSVRTLRRRLKKEGITFQQFKDNTRKQAAEQYLARPEFKINTVSALLGFDDPSAFHRSFKKWTGMTPGEFRARRDIN
jgi:AraC-like DNA-binding protein